MSNKSTKKRVLFAYVLVFYSVWTAWEFWGKGVVSGAVGNEYLAQLIKSGVVKNLVWTLPALVLIHRFGADMYVGLREMFAFRARLFRYFPLVLLFTVYLLIGAFLQKGTLDVSETFGPSEVIIVLFVGVTEETVFRGWLLNSTFSETSKWPALIVNSLMFLLIHFPVWICDGVFVSNFRTLGFLSVPILSVIFGWTFIKSRSIWIPIALHMYWDLLMFMLY